MTKENQPTFKQKLNRTVLVGLTAFGGLSMTGCSENISDGTQVKGSHGATTLREDVTTPGANIRETFIVPENGIMTITNDGYAGRKTVYRVRSNHCVPINPDYKEESEYYENETAQVPCTGQVYGHDIEPIK